MKILFLSFVVGLGVGVLYGLIRVKSPAPPIVALLGLLGMVLGEQLGIWVHTKKVDLPRAAAVCLVGEASAAATSVQKSLRSVGPSGRSNQVIVNLGEKKCASQEMSLGPALHWF